MYLFAPMWTSAPTTAKALVDGLCSDGSLSYAVSGQSPDPLFTRYKRGCSALILHLLLPVLWTMPGGDLDRLHEDNNTILTHMQHLSAPLGAEMCTRYNLPPTRAELTDLPNSVSVEADGSGRGFQARWPLPLAWPRFLLEYAQWPDISAGWGQVDGRVLREVLPVHTSVFNTVNRAPVVARLKGASLLSEMMAALEGTHRDQRCNVARWWFLWGTTPILPMLAHCWA